MTNRGVLVRPRQPTDFIAGASPIVYQELNPSADWRPYEPTHPVPQHSDVVDYMDCVSESMVHDIETQIKRYTGQDVDLSERFIAKMSNTTPQGNYQTVVADTIRKYGIPLETDWPHPTDPHTTWDQFYAAIPQSVKDKALKFLEQWNFQYEFVNHADVPKHLKQAPLQVLIEATNPYHAQELVTQTVVFDSYPPYEKPLKSVYDFLKPLITPKSMNQAKIVKSKKSPAIYVCYEMPDMDYLNKKANIEGFTIPSQIPDTDTL